MYIKTKQIILIITFLLISIVNRAQDKYEYAIIQYDTYHEALSISIDGEIFLKEKTELPKEERLMNANPFLKKIKEYQDKGWEVLNFINTPVGANGNIYHPVYFSYLRKKKNN